jgi:hypothetical protein
MILILAVLDDACMLFLFVDDRIKHYKSWVEGLNRGCCLQSILCNLLQLASRAGALATASWLACVVLAECCGALAESCGILRGPAAGTCGILRELAEPCWCLLPACSKVLPLSREILFKLGKLFLIPYTPSSAIDWDSFGSLNLTQTLTYLFNHSFPILWSSTHDGVQVSW